MVSQLAKSRRLSSAFVVLDFLMKISFCSLFRGLSLLWLKELVSLVRASQTLNAAQVRPLIRRRPEFFFARNRSILKVGLTCNATNRHFFLVE